MLDIYLPIAQVNVDIFLLLFLSLAVGILSGLFGVGGGFLTTPILIVSGIPPAVAVATEANQIVASSFSGVLAHLKRKTVDLKMGSITQKGSGSFAILLDADQVRGDGKFAIYSNTAIPGVGTQLLSVSESMETRAYGHLKVDTNITASGNISASGQIIGTLDGGTF